MPAIASVMMYNTARGDSDLETEDWMTWRQMLHPWKIDHGLSSFARKDHPSAGQKEYTRLEMHLMNPLVYHTWDIWELIICSRVREGIKVDTAGSNPFPHNLLEDPGAFDLPVN